MLFLNERRWVVCLQCSDSATLVFISYDPLDLEKEEALLKWTSESQHAQKEKRTDAPSHMHGLGLWRLFEQWFYEWITLFCGAFLKFLPAQKPLSLTWRSKITHLALHVGSACSEWRGPFSDRRRIVSLTLWCPCWELFKPLFSAYFTKSQNFRAHGIFPNLSMGFCTSTKIKSNVSHWVSSLFSCAHQTKNTFFICVFCK